MQSLKGKTALITGAGKGIGKAVALALAEEGVNVVLVARTAADVEAVAKEAEAKGVKAFALTADVAELVSITTAVEKAVAKFGTIDILINNAGIFKPQAFTDITDADWFKFFEVNVLSGVRLSRHYFPKMIAKDWGRIIFISSESAVNIPEEMIHYGMTKTAQLAVSRGLAELTKGTNVTVNSVLPGPTKSEGVAEFVKQLGAANNVSTEQAETDFFKDARPTSLLQRFTSVEEIANLVTYVASPLSSGTNGSALKVDGGVAKFII